MYKVIKNVLNARNYELSTVLTKIKTLWLENEISDEEKEELVELARANAQSENSYAPLQEQVDTLYGIVKELKAEVAALKNGGVVPEDPVEEYPEYVQPTGGHDAYKVGDKITYDGKRYECLANGCVWTPVDYPQGWKLVE